MHARVAPRKTFLKFSPRFSENKADLARTSVASLAPLGRNECGTGTDKESESKTKYLGIRAITNFS